MSKTLCLGTALWGWSVTKAEAFSMLDAFYSYGGRHVDTAANYPINSNDADFGKSSLFLSEWCRAHEVNDLKIIFKAGSLSNQNTPQNDLTYNHLRHQLGEAKRRFGKNIDTLMIHWDDRSDASLIGESCRIINDLKHENCGFGLSGIKNPELYYPYLAKSSPLNLDIELKFNFVNRNLPHYSSLTSLAPRMWAYGISVNGLKLNQKDYRRDSYVSIARDRNFHQTILTEELKTALTETLDRNPKFESIYHIALAFSERTPELFGYLIGPSSLKQLTDIFEFLKNLNLKQVDLTPLLRER